MEPLIFRSLRGVICAPWILAVMASVAGSSRGDAPQAIPVAWPASRYEKLMARSPFALATPAQPGSGPQASFAMNWYVSGIGRLHGQDFVTIESRDLAQRFSLFGHEPNAGVMLSSIEWSDRVGKSMVTIKKGNETATLEFNEAAVQGAGLVASPAGNPLSGTRAAPCGKLMVQPSAIEPARAAPGALVPGAMN
jgi:hypothetical protein